MAGRCRQLLGRLVPAPLGWRVVGALYVAFLGACASPTPATPVHAWAAEVGSLRASADAALRNGRHREARQRLQALLALEAPSSERHGRAMRQLKQEARFKLGRTHYALGDFEAAVAVAAEGLRLDGRSTVFRANLAAVKAMAHEALGQTAEAVADYETAIAVHRVLFDAALGGDLPSEAP